MAKLKGKDYSDDDLRAIFTDAATKFSCAKYAYLLGRNPGAIELIYRWAMTPLKLIKKNGRASALRYKKIAKEMGWVV